MKKVLSVVLAVAMVLACVASLAFVVGVNPGIDTPTNNALKVEDFYVTDELAMTTGVKLYAQIADLENQLYAKNQIVRFAVDLAVYNPTYAANGVKNTATTGDSATLTFESETVDFGLNATNAGTMVLYKPMYIGANIVTTSYANAVANEKYTPELSQDHHSMDVDVTYFTTDGAFLTLQDAAKSTFNKNNGVMLYGVSGDPTVVKTDFTLVITGLTTGELDQEGRVTVSMQDKAGDTFSDAIGGRGVVTVEKNGRTYKILKWYDADPRGKAVTNNSSSTVSYYALVAAGDLRDSYEHSGGYNVNGTYALLWADEDSASITSYNSQMYDADVVGYEVFRHLSNGPDGRENTADDIWGLIGMFETEQIRTGSVYDSVEARGQDIEGGRSLGMDYWDGKQWHRVYGNSLDAYGQIVYYKGNTNDQIFTTSGTIDYLQGFTFAENGSYRYTGAAQTGYVSARTALNDFLSDFGMGTGSQYSYKIQDSNFTEAATYDQLGEATYNGNAIVIEQPEEDPDVEEPTDNDEVPDEGDIDEEPIPDEPIPDENPEPVPETGDASAAVAVALTAAALVAAAGLAVVLKKAR